MKIASLFLLRAGGRNIHKIRIHSRTHSSTFIHPSSSCLAGPPHNTYYDTVCCSLRTIIYSKTVKLIWSRSVVTRTVVWEQVRSFGRTPYERKRQQRCLNHFSVIKITPGARDVGFLSGRGHVLRANSFSFFGLTRLLRSTCRYLKPIIKLFNHNNPTLQQVRVLPVRPNQYHPN